MKRLFIYIALAMLLIPTIFATAPDSLTKSQVYEMDRCVPSGEKWGIGTSFNDLFGELIGYDTLVTTEHLIVTGDAEIGDSETADSLTVTAYGLYNGTQTFNDSVLIAGGQVLSYNGATATNIMKFLTNLQIIGSADVTIEATGGQLKPSANDGVALGEGTVAWSDLYLADAGAINFDNGDITITQIDDTLIIAGGNTRVIQLQIDASGNNIDVTTDMDFSSVADMVFTPAGLEAHIVGGLSVGDETAVGDNNFKVVGTSNLADDITLESAATITNPDSLLLTEAGGIGLVGPTHVYSTLEVDNRVTADVYFFDSGLWWESPNDSTTWQITANGDTLKTMSSADSTHIWTNAGTGIWVK